MKALLQQHLMFLPLIAAIVNFLLCVYGRYPSSPMGEGARDMTLATLRAMANGGIHDHVAQVTKLEFSFNLIK